MSMSREELIQELMKITEQQIEKYADDKARREQLEALEKANKKLADDKARQALLEALEQLKKEGRF